MASIIIKQSRNQKLQAVFHEENIIDISPLKLYEFLIALILKFIKKRTL